jgi:hypothetical protein
MPKERRPQLHPILFKDVLVVSRALGLRRGGLCASDFAKKTIEAVIIKAKISPDWAKAHANIVRWARERLAFDPQRNPAWGGNAVDPDDDEPITDMTLRLSLLESWIKQYNGDSPYY